MTMTGRRQRNWRLAFWISLASLLVSGYFGYRVAEESPLRGAVVGMLSSLAIATPIYVLAYTQNSWQTAALILLVPGIFHYTYLGPTFGVVR